MALARIPALAYLAKSGIGHSLRSILQPLLDFASAAALYERAVNLVSADTRRGGEYSLWLAQAMHAAGDEGEAVSLLRALEKSHRDRAVSVVAAEILYIFTAPKLELGKDSFIGYTAIDASAIFTSHDAHQSRRGYAAKPPPTSPPTPLTNPYPPDATAASAAAPADRAVSIPDMTQIDSWDAKKSYKLASTLPKGQDYAKMENGPDKYSLEWVKDQRIVYPEPTSRTEIVLVGLAIAGATASVFIFA